MTFNDVVDNADALKVAMWVKPKKTFFAWRDSGACDYVIVSNFQVVVNPLRVCSKMVL